MTKMATLMYLGAQLGGQKTWGLADLSPQWGGRPLEMVAQRSKAQQKPPCLHMAKPRTDTALLLPHSTSLCKSQTNPDPRGRK